MAQYIKNANIWGRVGTGIGQGLAEQIPKEIERGRLASGLEKLGDQKNMTPFQQFARLSSLPGITPQMIQSGSDLLRQQSIIDNYKNAGGEQSPSGNNQRQYQNQNQEQQPKVELSQKSGVPLSSATTTQSTKAALDPYIPPTGAEIEQKARQRMAQEPLIYPNIEAARQSILSEVAADQNQSNALLNKRGLEEDVQNKAEGRLQKEIETVGARVPGTVMTKLQQEAVDDVRTGKLTPEQAKVKYGKKADQISRDFSNINSWGNLSLITKSPKSLFNAIRSVQENAKSGNYQKEAADSLIASNGLTPEMSYAQMYPVSEQKALNHAINALPDINMSVNKVVGAGPGLAGVGVSSRSSNEIAKKTMDISPRLALAMGKDGSPLSIGYELRKKGYDVDVWNKFLLDNKDNLNLTSHQIEELGKPKPGFFGWMNDWWLKSFSGVK